ncbi:hypothetical protein [Streptomyces sp. NPDC027717]
MAELFRESLITATYSALCAFNADMSALQDASGERIFAAVQRVVLP